MDLASKLTIVCCGLFFLTGLLTGVWKYACIASSESATAPVYVDVAHRASLLYAFASLVVLQFLQLSPFGPALNLLCALAPQVFFALAIATYVIHGALRDTDNQLRAPHRLGDRTLPAWVIHGFMVALIAAELGGFGALFVGALFTLFGS